MLTKFRDLEALIEAGDKEAALQKLAELEVVVLGKPDPITEIEAAGRTIQNVLAAYNRVFGSDEYLDDTEAHDDCAMFNFFGMADDYEDRKVDRYDTEEMMISTAMVTDGRKPFETAVRHPSYNDNKIVIVECYDTREDAQSGHEAWVKVMTTDPLPDKLIDCGNAEISQFADAVGCEMEFPRQND